MDPFTAAMAVSSVVSVGSSLIGGSKAKKAAKKAAKEQAQLTGQMRDTQIRQARRKARHQLGTATAAVGASNIQMSGSSLAYTESLDYENMREIASMVEAKRQEQKAIKAGAAGAGDAFFAQAAGDAIGAAVQGFLAFKPTPHPGVTHPGSAATPAGPDNMNPLSYGDFGAGVQA